MQNLQNGIGNWSHDLAWTCTPMEYSCVIQNYGQHSFLVDELV